MRLDLSVPAQLMTALAPDLVLVGGSMILLLWAAWRPDSAAHQRRVGFASIGLALITMAIVGWFMANEPAVTNGPIAADLFRWTSDQILLVGTIGAIALSIEYNEREGILGGEAHVLTLLATSGMMTMAAARDLIVLFLGLEIMSIAVYVLVGLNRRSVRSAEGALKYFLLGAFSTCFLLYGIALVYGATGSTNLPTIADRVVTAGHDNAMLLLGVGLLLIGFGFKIAAVPFHMWAPDVYDGAPTPTTAYMAAAVKAAGFAAFLRVWLEAVPALGYKWHLAVWWLAAVTMVFGNLVALAQKNVKRMLAYSSIAHGGYILIAVVAGPPFGSAAFLFYAFAYTLATIGAFAVVVALSGSGDRYLQIEDYAGLWGERPWIAAAMAVFMLALLGFPIFGGMGFLAKWYMVHAALRALAPQSRLVVLLVVMSVVSAGYYLYVVVVMFMKPRPADSPSAAPVMPVTRWVIAACAALIVVLGIYPGPAIRLARRSDVRAPEIRTPAVQPLPPLPGAMVHSTGETAAATPATVEQPTVK